MYPKFAGSPPAPQPAVRNPFLFWSEVLALRGVDVSCKLTGHLRLQSQVVKSTLSSSLWKKNRFQHTLWDPEHVLMSGPWVAHMERVTRVAVLRDSILVSRPRRLISICIFALGLQTLLPANYWLWPRYVLCELVWPTLLVISISHEENQEITWHI